MKNRGLPANENENAQRKKNYMSEMKNIVTLPPAKCAVLLSRT